MDWSAKTPGRTPMGGGGKYHKPAAEFLEDYKNLVDYMADHTSFNAVIIWGFLRDSHGGVAAGQELCRYAKTRGIRIVPGVGTSGYEGYYFEGDHEYNITTRLKAHPELSAIGRDGKPHRALCRSKPANVQWLKDGCRWLFDTFEIGGINFEIGDFLVCYCGDCKQARAAIPTDAPDYYKDMAITTAPVAKLAHEIAPDAWLSYATYTGFTPAMAERKPDWVDLIPEQILCQWTLTGMVSDIKWPPGLRPPTKENTGYLHWGNKSTTTVDHIFLRRIQDVCRRAQEAEFRGLATYGEDPPSRSEANAIFAPSGDQAGSESRTLSLVRFVCPDPLGFIRWISQLRPVLHPNAILSPSGDQVGWKSHSPLPVSWVCPDPSAFITWILWCSSRSDWNAILLPSGDQLGTRSSSVLLVSCVTLAPSASIT